MEKPKPDDPEGIGANAFNKTVKNPHVLHLHGFSYTADLHFARTGPSGMPDEPHLLRHPKLSGTVFQAVQSASSTCIFPVLRFSCPASFAIATAHHSTEIYISLNGVCVFLFRVVDWSQVISDLTCWLQNN